MHRIDVHLPVALVASIDEAARSLGMSRNALVRSVLERHMSPASEEPSSPPPNPPPSAPGTATTKKPRLWARQMHLDAQRARKSTRRPR